MKRVLDAHEYELPFSQESDGTKKLISALPVLLLALQEGRLVIIDELDAKLHPKLLRYVISLFKSCLLYTSAFLIFLNKLQFPFSDNPLFL